VPIHRVSGKTVTPFNIEIDLPTNTKLTSKTTLRKIADAAGFKGRVDDISIDWISELDSDGNEIRSQLNDLTVRTLGQSFARRQQGRSLLRLLAIGKRRVRIDVYSDTYDFQSRAIAELFDGDKWNTIAFIEYANMKSAGKCMGHDLDAKHDDLLRADADAVLQEALLILSS
jgi:hypothetical protein